MKKSIILVFAAMLFVTLLVQAQPKKLFNGTDLSGWHVDVPELDKDANVKSPFIVRDGLLVSLGKPGGHLITDAVYQNYRLEVEYRFSAKPGNCGVLVHASTPRALYSMFPKSVEVQLMHENAGDFWCIVEDIAVPDMESRRGPKEKWGSTEGKERRVRNLTDGSEKPAGEWNTVTIECIDRTVSVWVNGQLVNQGFDCTADKGQIALQSEGSEVEFRKVELQPIVSKPRVSLNHTAIYVRSMKTSAAFYHDIIGLDTIPEPFHDGKHAWFKTGPGTALHIIEGAKAKKEYYKNQHTCFSVPSVDSFVVLLKKNNIYWEDRDGAKKAITTRVDGVKQLWLQDPDGYWIEINDAK
jgi:catechol 2,3-dioxygenase-like lactoylglutathione lyase family enzyme